MSNSNSPAGTFAWLVQSGVLLVPGFAETLLANASFSNDAPLEKPVGVSQEEDGCFLSSLEPLEADASSRKKRANRLVVGPFCWAVLLEGSNVKNPHESAAACSLPDLVWLQGPGVACPPKPLLEPRPSDGVS